MSGQATETRRHPSAPDDAAETVLAVTGVDVVRQGRDILHGITLEVRAGEHWALIGANGAGKTTLLRLCGALSHPTHGTVDVLGRRIGRVDLRELRGLIGHVDPRHPVREATLARDVVLTGLTGTSETMMRWRPSAAESSRAESLLRLLGVAARADDPWRDLSQGERGRVLIARALVGEPRLLLLDEPTTGLDIAAREQLLDRLDEVRVHRPSLASILVTHHLEELPASTTHVAVLREGRIVGLGPAEETLTGELLSLALGYPLLVSRTGGRWSVRARH